MNPMDRRNWVWLPGRLRFRVLGLIDVVALWILVAALLGAGTWWGLDTYWKHRDYCTEDLQLRRMGPRDECIGVTASAYGFAAGLADVLGRIEQENRAALDSGRRVVSVAVVMPYTQQTEGAAMSERLIRHSLQGAYVAQHGYNQDSDTAIQLLFANVGENLDHWRAVTDELASRVTGEAPVVAAIGFPNSNDKTLASVRQGLGRDGIPAVSAVLSSREMEDPHLFKVSPSTNHLVDALKHYVRENSVNDEDTFMIADDQQADNYVNNLRRVFFEEFGEDYGINDDAVESRIATYRGKQGSERGEKRQFRQAVTRMCAARAKTVFLAGRDVDLPPFLSAIAQDPSCNQGTADEPLRILRVSTGRDPDTETSAMRDIAERKHIEIVTAAAVDAPRWRAGSPGDKQVPQYFRSFARAYEEYFGDERGNALDDGYAVMYHDALAAVGRAVDEAQTNGVTAMDHSDIYDELRRLNTSEGCAGGCVPGASGVFAFANEDIRLDKGEKEEAVVGRWPVCKPVPIVTFPDDPQDATPLYRTYLRQGRNTCPDL
ncbi:hypothetical protein [Streptomyces sp. UG1]|uniref:hypothetical protein n=1 Tax=Streptomyces sp. UG1 TaxID=3417652 RepID=UPI003CF38A75